MQTIKILKKGRWYAMLLLLLAAVYCAKEKELLPENAQAVRFSAAITNNATRAAGTQWTAGDKIGIRMFDENGNIVDGYANMPYVTDANGNFTATAGDMYYPENGANVGFSAYYPYHATLQNGSFTINFADQSNPEALDLLYAATTAQYDKFSTIVAIPFRHVMSKLVLKTQAGTGLTVADLVGMSVSIAGLNSTATFNTVSGVLINAETPATITPRTLTDGSHYEAIVLPASLAAQTMKVTFAVGGKEYVWDAPALTFEQGKAHEWILTINRAGITVTAGNITPWITSTVINANTAPYKIGDYYPDPANPATAIGVVFSISNGGKEGKVISLNEGMGKQWSSENSGFGATSLDDGQLNTNIIKTYKDNNPTSTLTFPAFEWCIDKGERWYLPAKNEILALYNQKMAVNAALASIAGATQLNNDGYWSSSEYYNGYAWFVSLSDGKADNYSLNFPLRVRAVSAF